MSANCNCELNGTNSTRSMLSWTRFSRAWAVPTNRGLALRVNSVVRPILDLVLAGSRVPHPCAFIAFLFLFFQLPVHLLLAAEVPVLGNSLSPRGVWILSHVQFA